MNKPSHPTLSHTSDDTRLMFITLALALINIGNNFTMMTDNTILRQIFRNTDVSMLSTAE